MITLDQNPKTALITGAAGGLGQSLVKHFLAAGWAVAAGQHLHRVYEESDSLLPVQLNVTDQATIDSAVRQIIEKWGRIDALINNAGITADGPVARMSDIDWGRVMDVNLKGAFLCSQAVIRTMFKQRSGHIINISSFAAKNGHLGQPNYVAAKAGLVGLTQSLAKESGARNVKVNAIFPGVLDTAMTANLTDEQRARIEDSNVLNRTTTLEEVSSFIVHLADMEHVSGQVFQLDSRVGKWV